MRPDKSYVPAGIIPVQPTCEIAELFPAQGTWTESEYFALETQRRMEFSHGFIEFLPMPTLLHQRITPFLYNALNAFVLGLSLGEVLFRGVRVRLWPGKFREPDVLFMSAEHSDRVTERILGRCGPGDGSRELERR